MLTFASRRQWTLKLPHILYLENSFVTAKTLTLPDWSTRDVSLPELIMGSYMVVLTFQFASLWNIRWWLFKWISFSSIFTWYDLFLLQLNEGSEFLSNWLRRLLGVKGLPVHIIHSVKLFVKFTCMLNRRCNIVQRRTPFTQCLYSFRLHGSPNGRLLRNTIAPM